jgi:hypothetical protein
MLQLVWLLLLALHIGAAGVWWWLMPGGFPSSATEFWVNQFWPPVIVVLLVVALLARGKLGEALLPAALAAIPAFWLTFGLSARLTFDASFESAWHTPFVLAFGLAVLWIHKMRLRVRAWWLVPLFVIPAAIFGWALPGTQRAPEPSTTPTGASFAPPPPVLGDAKVIKLAKDAQVRPDEGRVVVKRDKMILNVLPFLSFTDRSPDRSWVSLAPEGTSKPTNRILAAKVRDGAGWKLYYKDEDGSVLGVTSQGTTVQLDAASRIAKPIFSHLNAWAELAVSGHTKLTVSFSPVPDKRVELAAPTAAERFAYVDANDTFHIMQATTRQRGPFTEIASGRLKKGDPLVVTLYDGDKATFAVTLADWSAQASTALSPTAGAGIPVNAIELLRAGEPETAPALVTFSLASTSIGRGTQSVGHTAGVYRDRMTIELPK